jgi:hypothetical protein
MTRFLERTVAVVTGTSPNIGAGIALARGSKAAGLERTMKGEFQ